MFVLLDELLLEPIVRSPVISFAHGDLFSSLAISSLVQLSGSLVFQKSDAANKRSAFHGSTVAPASCKRLRREGIIRSLTRHDTAFPWERSAPSPESAQASWRK